MRAIVVNDFGGPEVLTVTDIALPELALGQVLVNVTLSGVNFLDVYQRAGAIPMTAPFTAGVEGVGVVTAVADEVTDLAIGQRVGWFSAVKAASPNTRLS